MLNKIRQNFIDRTAKKPSGTWALKHYTHPKAHFHSFKIIMKDLNLGPDDRYCEIGCGGGVLLNMAMARAGSGAALDHSMDMVELSRDNNREYLDQGRLEIIRGNAEILPWEPASFTACASANMFFFVENPRAVLSEVYRILEPKGRFSMVTAGKGFFAFVVFGWLYRMRTYTDTAMTAMMRDTGFKNIRVNSGITGTIQVCYGEK